MLTLPTLRGKGSFYSLRESDAETKYAEEKKELEDAERTLCRSALCALRSHQFMEQRVQGDVAMRRCERILAV
jgi:hypothetical protein